MIYFLPKLKRIIIFFLVVNLVFLNLPVSALALENEVVENVEIENVGAEITDTDTANQFDFSQSAEVVENLSENKDVSDDINEEMMLDSVEEFPYFTDGRKSHENKLKDEEKNSSGALVYSFPIKIPRGRNSFEPDLSIFYNSQSSKQNGVFGYGWEVNIPYIERVNRKGVEKLYTENYFISSESGELEDINLSDSAHGIYGAKYDNGNFAKYKFETDNSWLDRKKRR